METFTIFTFARLLLNVYEPAQSFRISKSLHVFNVDEVIEFQHEVMSKTDFGLTGAVVRK